MNMGAIRIRAAVIGAVGIKSPAYWQHLGALFRVRQTETENVNGDTWLSPSACVQHFAFCLVATGILKA